MILLPEERAVEIAEYISDTACTVREAAKAFDISKSTVHTDVTVKLRTIDPELFLKVRNVLDTNKKERHLRGGRATKEKYSCKKP